LTWISNEESLINFSKNLKGLNDDKETIKIIRDIDVPVLLVHGMEDHVVNYKNTERLARNIKGSQYYLIKNGTHYLPLEQWELVSNIIRKFITRNKEEEAMRCSNDTYRSKEIG